MNASKTIVSNDTSNKHIVSDYIFQADVNNDGVITQQELRYWLSRIHTSDNNHSQIGKESDMDTGIDAVRFVPEGSANAVHIPNDQYNNQPTSLQLKQHFIKIAIPFVGFGFLDNFIMIISGSEIESYFGVSLGLSAMAAAGLGNTLSDIVGIQASGMIEAMSDSLPI